MRERQQDLHSSIERQKLLDTQARQQLPTITFGSVVQLYSVLMLGQCSRRALIGRSRLIRPGLIRQRWSDAGSAGVRSKCGLLKTVGTVTRRSV